MIPKILKRRKRFSWKIIFLQTIGTFLLFVAARSFVVSYNAETIEFITTHSEDEIRKYFSNSTIGEMMTKDFYAHLSSWALAFVTGLILAGIVAAIKRLKAVHFLIPVFPVAVVDFFGVTRPEWLYRFLYIPGQLISKSLFTSTFINGCMLTLAGIAIFIPVSFYLSENSKGIKTKTDLLDSE